MQVGGKPAGFPTEDEFVGAEFGRHFGRDPAHFHFVQSVARGQFGGIQGQRRRRRGPYAKSAERRRQIVDAAFELFAAHGYRGASLQDVADRVGLSQTGLLHYFPSKRELLIAVLAKRGTNSDGNGNGQPH